MTIHDNSVTDSLERLREFSSRTSRYARFMNECMTLIRSMSGARTEEFNATLRYEDFDPKKLEDCVAALAACVNTYHAELVSYRLSREAVLKQRHAIVLGGCLSCRATGRDPASDNLNWLPCVVCGGTGKAK